MTYPHTHPTHPPTKSEKDYSICSLISDTHVGSASHDACYNIYIYIYSECKNTHISSKVLSKEIKLGTMEMEMQEELQIVPMMVKDVEAQFVEIMVPLYSYGCGKKIKKALAHFKGR